MPEPKKPTRGRFSAFLAGESRTFSVFMILAALILTVILVVGIVTDRREKAEEAAPETTTAAITEGYHAT